MPGRKSLILMLSLIALWACKEDPFDYVPPDLVPVYVGEFDSTEYFFEDYGDSMCILIEWDSSGAYGYGKLGLDLDGDSIEDILFSHQLWNSDSSFYPPNPLALTSWVRLFFIEGMQIASDIETFGAGHGQIGTIERPAVLAPGTELTTFQKWRITPRNMDLYYYPVMGTIGPTEGEWFYHHDKAFLGFRKDYRHGWLEIDMTDPFKPRFLRMAMKKN